MMCGGILDDADAATGEVFQREKESEWYRVLGAEFLAGVRV